MPYYRLFGVKTHKMVTLSCFRMATIWRVFAWRPFAPPCKDTTNRGENVKGRHAKTRQMLTYSYFRMASFRPATRKYATFHALRSRLLFVVSLPSEANGRHAKTRQNHHLAFFFAWRPFAFSPRKHVYIRHGTNQLPFETVPPPEQNRKII